MPFWSKSAGSVNIISIVWLAGRPCPCCGEATTSSACGVRGFRHRRARQAQAQARARAKPSRCARSPIRHSACPADRSDPRRTARPSARRPPRARWPAQAGRCSTDRCGRRSSGEAAGCAGAELEADGATVPELVNMLPIACRFQYRPPATAPTTTRMRRIRNDARPIDRRLLYNIRRHPAGAQQSHAFRRASNPAEAALRFGGSNKCELGATGSRRRGRRTHCS